MSAAELQKFPQHRWGQAFTTLKCDCPPYLLWLEKRSVCCRMGVGRKAQARGNCWVWTKLEKGWGVHLARVSASEVSERLSALERR